MRKARRREGEERGERRGERGERREERGEEREEITEESTPFQGVAADRGVGPGCGAVLPPDRTEWGPHSPRASHPGASPSSRRAPPPPLRCRSSGCSWCCGTSCRPSCHPRTTPPSSHPPCCCLNTGPGADVRGTRQRKGCRVTQEARVQQATASRGWRNGDAGRPGRRSRRLRRRWGIARGRRCEEHVNKMPGASIREGS
jgi:hypothetical protein